MIDDNQLADLQAAVTSARTTLEERRKAEPATTGDRTATGQFVPGHNVGKLGGNPHVRTVAKNRSAMLEAVTDEDIQEILRMLVKLAKKGDKEAAAAVLDRVIGKPVASDLIEHMERLGQAVAVMREEWLARHGAEHGADRHAERMRIARGG